MTTQITPSQIAFADFPDLIGLTELEKSALLEVSISPAKYGEWKALFENDRQECFRRVEAEEDAGFWYLYFFCRLACDCATTYHQRQLDLEIFRMTFSDIAIWSREYFCRHNKNGLSETRWLARHLDCTLFRLGRLQYERVPFRSEADVVSGIKQGQPVINVHIPAGERLEIDKVLDSLGRAREFWQEEIPYICHSWLLYSGLREFLPPTSNIIRFQELFEIFHTDFNVRQGEERIYGELKADAGEYPENTSLQQSAKAYLLSGKKLGNGWGRIDREKVEQAKLLYS